MWDTKHNFRHHRRKTIEMDVVPSVGKIVSNQAQGSIPTPHDQYVMTNQRKGFFFQEALKFSAIRIRMQRRANQIVLESMDFSNKLEIQGRSFRLQSSPASFMVHVTVRKSKASYSFPLATCVCFHQNW